MKIAVVGAGIQGSVCAGILAGENDIDSVTVIDNNPERLRNVFDANASPKIICHICDIRNKSLAETLLRGSDVIFDMLIPEFTEQVMKIALNIKAHYINTAYDNPFWNSIIDGKELPFNREFAEAGLTALLGCGDSPGLVNIFVRKYCDLFDSIDSIRICGAYKNPKNENDKNWNPGWSRRQAYLDFITPPVVFKDGRYIFREQFSDEEMIDFPDYGPRRLALHSHEEVYSLPRIIGRQIQNCEFKYQEDPYAKRLFTEGYIKGANIFLNGQKLCALDVLFNKFDLMKYNSSDNDDEYTSIIEISGGEKGKAKSIKVLLPPLYKERKLALDLFNTTKIDVALPAVVFMKCLPDMPEGVHFAEEVSPKLFEQILNLYIPYREVLL